MWASEWIASRFSVALTPALAGIIGGIACILGHNFPVWLKFKGGKGMATSAGVVTPFRTSRQPSSINVLIPSRRAASLISTLDPPRNKICRIALLIVINSKSACRPT